MKTLLIATHNQGKVKEFDEMLNGSLGGLGIEIKSAADFDLPEPEETETTFEGNALLKARAGCVETGLPTLADDSGFCVGALNGDPGIYSARWAETDEGRNFDMAMEAVHKKAQESEDKGAWFVAVLALVYPDGQEFTFEGRIDGTHIWPPRGDKGFGYDPMFVPEGGDKTFAEIDPSEKHAMSHRARATQKFLAFIKEKNAA